MREVLTIICDVEGLKQVPSKQPGYRRNRAYTCNGANKKANKAKAKAIQDMQAFVDARRTYGYR